MLRTTLSRAHAGSKAASVLRARGLNHPITEAVRFYARKGEARIPDTIRTLHPFIGIHEVTVFDTNMLTFETETGKRDFENRDKYRASVTTHKRERHLTKIKNIQERKRMEEGVLERLTEGFDDKLTQLYSRAKKATTLEELKDICYNIDSNDVLGHHYGDLKGSYHHLRKNSALAIVAQKIFFKYQALTEEAGETLDAQPLLYMLGYIYAKFPEDPSYVSEPADALLWVACKCGSLEDIIAVITTMTSVRFAPSDYTVAEALAPRLQQIAKITDVDEKLGKLLTLFPMRELFTKCITPELMIAMFGLCSRLDEFVSAFKIAHEYHTQNEMTESTPDVGPAMLKAVVRCTKNEAAEHSPDQDEIFFDFNITRPSHQAMAYMMSVSRYLKLAINTKYTPRALETTLVLCAKDGNIAGLNRALQWYQDERYFTQPVTITRRTTEKLLALFPFAQGMPEEALAASIDFSSMLQNTSYEAHIQFLETLKKLTEAKELVTEIEEKLKSIN